MSLAITHLKSPEGLKDILNVQVEAGSPMKQYYRRNGMGDRQGELDYRSLAKFTGYLYKAAGVLALVHPTSIGVIDEPEMVECDSTHVKLLKNYCVIPVKGTDGRMYNLSNYARMLSESQDIKSTSSQRVCGECPYNHRCPLQNPPPKLLTNNQPLSGHRL